MTAEKRKMIVVASMLVIGLASISAIEAGHKHSRRDPLVVLAVEIEDQARFVERRAERFSGRGHREYGALVRLERVQREARDFRVTLQRFGPNSRRTDRELFELNRAVRRAAQALPALRAYPRVRGEFRQLARMVDTMEHRLQTRMARRDRYRGKAYPTRRSGSRGYVSIGKHGKRGHASIGFSWDDEFDD